MVRSTTDHILKKRFPKLDFLEAVSVTIIANSDKMEMKKSHSPLRPLHFFSSSPLWFSPRDF